MLLRNIAAAGLVSLCTASMAQAVTLSAAGVEDLEVGGVLYNVEFLTGSCIENFTDCDTTSPDFTFTTEEDALAASNALLGLFNATGNETFTDDPTLTDGCTNSFGCFYYTPYAASFSGLPGNPFVQQTVFQNAPGSHGDSIGLDLELARDSGSYSGGTNVWAKFSQTDMAPIPVPASLPLLAFGLAGLMALGQRKRKSS